MKRIIHGIHARIFFLFCICCLASLPAYAEFYQYTDDSGTFHFTDDITDVPVDQRPDVKRYHSLEPDAPPVQPDVSDQKPNASDKNQVQATDALLKEKIQLDQEYDQLVKERDGLSKMPAKEASPEDVASYKRRVDDLNQRIKEFEQKRKTFKEKVDRLRSPKKAATQ